MPPAPPPNMQQLLKQAQKMQAQVAQAQQSLTEATVDGTVGGGLVTATCTGTGELVNLVISKDVVDPDDVETLTDLVIAAVRDAQREAHELAERTMGPLTAGLPPGLGF